MQRTITALKPLFHILLFVGFSLLPIPSINSQQNINPVSLKNPLQLWEKYIQYNVDSCKLLAIQLRASSSNNQKNAAIFHLVSGSYLTRIGMYEEALRHLSISKSYFFQLQDFELLSKIYNEIGIALHYSGNLTDAVSYYKSSIESGINSENELAEILAEINLAKLYITEGKYDPALNHVFHYISIARKHNKYEALSNAYATLVDFYLTKEDISMALKYAKELLYIAGKSNNLNISVLALTNQAILSFYNEEPQKALAIFQQILSIRKAQNLPLKLAEAYFNLAGFYLEENPIISKLYIDSAYTISKKNKLYTMEEDILLFKKDELKDSTAEQLIQKLKLKMKLEKESLLNVLKIKENTIPPSRPFAIAQLFIYLLVVLNICLIAIALFKKLTN